MACWCLPSRRVHRAAGEPSLSGADGSPIVPSRRAMLERNAFGDERNALNSVHGNSCLPCPVTTDAPSGCSQVVLELAEDVCLCRRRDHFDDPRLTALFPLVGDVDLHIG